MVKNIVITGATGDIAKEIVSLLSKTNDHLILVSRSRTALEKLYGQLANVTLLTNDELLTAEQSYDVDILINNAGFGIFKDFTELTDSEITEQFVINTLMPIQLTRQLKPRLQLINIASIAGKLPTRKSSIYAASKAALITFSDALRMENPQLIVTTVNTGPVRTKFHKNNGDYLNKVDKSAISAAKVADKIVNNFGKRKRELNLPWTLSTAAKLRSLFPSLVDLKLKNF